MFTMQRVKQFLLALLCPIILLLLWQVAADSGQWSTYLLPQPRTVGQNFLELWQSGVLIKHVVVSLKRVLLGFSLAAMLAVPLAIAVGLWKPLYRLLSPTIEFFRHVPPLAMLPLLILWLGIGEGSKLAIVFLATFYPIFLNALSGFRSTDSHLLELAEQYHISRRSTFYHIRLPQAAPFLYTGLRIGLGYSWRSLIGAEMIAAASGLGYLVLDSQAMARSDLVIVGIFVIGISGICLDYLYRFLAFRLFGKYLRGGEFDEA